ncbi:hypothetical protein [Frigoribacterium sp. Leaf186]|uniref:hypothetical protein n=1 Tax=Frigoribacterium sp. Leaf186 TaxID=1736293 RepID=UPI0006F46601|nr:hypothetical protein [Frigoribacterium sp. Leaf186]KQS16372.1 hypothetical protein ASG05_11465 [Frigoribacterium sp. Leaf186]
MTDRRGLGQADTATGAGAAQPRVAFTATPFVTLIALSPIVAMALTVVVMRGALEQAVPGRTGVDAADLGLVQVVSLVLWVGIVVLAWLDHRTLRGRGLERPFAWGWALLGPLVYLIGRSVVVRRRVGGSAAPLWLYLGLTVLGSIVATIVVVSSGVPTA